MSYKALFLDRDGIINQDFGYVVDVDKFVFIDGIFDLVKAARLHDYKVVVVTNQSGIARGYYSQMQFLSLSQWMKDQFEQKDAPLDDVYFCPHHPREGATELTYDCTCRKPKPGMFVQAAIEHGIDLHRSVMLGDKPSDMQAAIAAGIQQNYLLTTDKTRLASDIEVPKGSFIRTIEQYQQITFG